MCTECGCGLPGDKPFQILGGGHDHENEGKNDYEGEEECGRGDHHHHHGHDHHGHSHGHDHSHSHHGHDHHHHHDHPHFGDEPKRNLDIHRSILDKNDRQAERNRGFFHARGYLVLNVLSSPGSGKTALIRETIRALGNRLKTAVIVGDLETDNDARRLRETSAEVIQITTGTVCHLEAEMVARAVKQLHLDGVQLLVIENVGNLVCPASYDLGEDLRVVLLSVTEGEDKPLKYPPMFQSANAAVVSKIDLAQVCEYNRAVALGNLERLAPAASVFEVSAKTGQGMEEWCAFLISEHRKVSKLHPLAG